MANNQNEKIPTESGSKKPETIAEGPPENRGGLDKLPKNGNA